MFGKLKEKDFKFELGSELRDKITGFSGVVVYRSQWIHGCNVYGLRFMELKDGKPMDTQQFDEPQLELVKPKVIEPSRKTGGPERPIVQSNRI